jgi:ribosomal protein L37E
MSYTISPDGKAITCGQCGLTSHNLHDVRHRYCGKCNIYHDDAAAAAEHDCSVEYDCSECGRHIYQFGGPQTGRCAACTTMPGWFRDPELAKRIDPEGDARPRSLQ